jgi:hypothetical protein
VTLNFTPAGTWGYRPFGHGIFTHPNQVTGTCLPGAQVRGRALIVGKQTKNTLLEGQGIKGQRSQGGDQGIEKINGIIV